MQSLFIVHRSVGRCAGIAVACLGLATVAAAGDPEQGRDLFEKPYEPRTTREFNAKTCAECHRMGGVGGAGPQQFNARSIGIEELRMPAGTTATELSRFLASLYPKWVGTNGTISTVAALPHFGGDPQYQLLRAELLRQLAGRQSQSGGPATHADLEAELNSEIHFSSGRMAVIAKSFQRNTPSLFGAGMIDAITDEQILNQARLQKRKRGVSGRPATLSTGGIGRFGWRGNVATLEQFTRQACLNELGLQVAPDPPERLLPAAKTLVPLRQPRRARADISRESLKSMTAFIKSLPAPRPIRPDDAESLKVVDQGERLFTEVGCSVCHVPDLGPAYQIYSDLLLHDMGETLRGASVADPYVYDYDELVSQPTVVAVRTGYYGATVPLTPNLSSNRISSNRFPAPGNRFSGRSHSAVQTLRRPYQRPPQRLQLIPLASADFVVREETGGRFRSAQQRVVRQVRFRRNRVRPTMVSQEWRTAPLWGLRDSAPYMHDGRAATVEDAIGLHGGEGRGSLRRYQSLAKVEQQSVLAFLDTLAAPTDAPRASRPDSFLVRQIGRILHAR